MILYHGSSKNIDKTIKAHKAFDLFDYDEVVYCTSIKEIALAYAISPIDYFVKNKFGIDKHYRAISAHIRYNKGILEIMELYPNMFESIYHNECYLYICDENNYKQNGNEYEIPHNVNFINKIHIIDLFDELKRLENLGKIKMYKYEDLDYFETYFQYESVESGLQNRASHCSSKEEIAFFEMISEYFPKVKDFIKLK